jgi:hypothetical protein
MENIVGGDSGMGLGGGGGREGGELTNHDQLILMDFLVQEVVDERKERGRSRFF